MIAISGAVVVCRQGVRRLRLGNNDHGTVFFVYCTRTSARFFTPVSIFRSCWLEVLELL